eukprot:CAMPEP_0170184184 /NCGR_PEP_ID=MMETSP0040_2-20121228/32919_1 /TAXON_ID=641309 /ORGANISM="Lotharella oceanica, Strain CCMP622" /LENGTH=145 /DNA_ID=CAMNT_0010430149 /DNA_START=327 /DNA_END=760 /DNA_ORIENTATION=+
MKTPPSRLQYAALMGAAGVFGRFPAGSNACASMTGAAAIGDNVGDFFSQSRVPRQGLNALNTPSWQPKTTVLCAGTYTGGENTGLREPTANVHSFVPVPRSRERTWPLTQATITCVWPETPDALPAGKMQGVAKTGAPDFVFHTA